MSKTILTSEGKKKLQEELNYLMTTEKMRIIGELSDAKDRSGVDENFEYEAAKEEFDRLLSKINKLTEIINNCVVVNSSEIDTSQVSIFSSVKVFNKSNKKEMKFTIVPDNEVDIKSGKISSSSPIGAGLIGKKVNEKTKIQTPSGIIELEILEITA